MDAEIRLGGRLFTPVNFDAITVRNEHYVMRLMRQTGIDRVLPLPAGESDDEYLLRLQTALVDTLKLPEILAGYLLPLGKTEADWTEKLARDTAAFIAGLTARADRAEVHRLGLDIALDFFRVGLASLGISPSFSASDAASPSPTPASVGVH